VGMSSITGTIILCDNVYQAQGGKFVLAGTYTTIEVRVIDAARIEHQINGLNMYLRLRPEQLGPLSCEIMIRDEALPPWNEPLLRNQWDVRVTERNIRLVEMAMMSPPFIVRPQVPPDATLNDMLVKYSIEFRINGEVIATTPLDVRFVRQPPF
jgi:hypothetical protein